MLLIFALCYLWLLLAGLALLASSEALSSLATVLLVGSAVAFPVGLVSGCCLWLTATRVLPAWLTTLVLWALAALPYALLAWWTGQPKTIETMLVIQAAISAVVWPVALAGVLKGLVIELAMVMALMIAVDSSQTAIKIAGSHLTAKLRLLVEIARSLGL